jgi:hypothetical protein
VHRGPRRHAELVVVNRGVAIQGECESEGLKPEYHFMGSRFVKNEVLSQATRCFHKLRGAFTSYEVLSQATGRFHKLRGAFTSYGALSQATGVNLC